MTTDPNTVTFELRALITELRKTDKTAGRRIARAMKEASRFVAEDAAREAREFSTRIPATVRVSATQKAVYVRAGGKRAPHADAWEWGKPHPLFGNRSKWYRVPAKGFLVHARDRNVERLATALADAVKKAIEEGPGG